MNKNQISNLQLKEMKHKNQKKKNITQMKHTIEIQSKEIIISDFNPQKKSKRNRQKKGRNYLWEELQGGAGGDGGCSAGAGWPEKTSDENQRREDDDDGWRRRREREYASFFFARA